MRSVPFKIPDAEGFTETEGLARFEEPYLVLEWQTKDAFTGTFYKTDLRETAIPIGDLSDVTLKDGFFGGVRLVVRTRSARMLEDLPGAKMGQVKLKFRRRDRAAVFELAEVIEYYLSRPELAWDDETPESGEY